MERTNIFQAKVLKNINLNKQGSKKETRHLELSLSGAEFAYEPGDVLGVVPQNDPELVKHILSEMNWNGQAQVVINAAGEQLSLEKALVEQFEITALSKKILQKAASWTPNKELHQLLEQPEKVKEYVSGRDILDLLRDFGPWNASAQELVSLLRKLMPRLYSIASSIAAHPGEIHLTVGAVRYETHGRTRKGVCSTLIAERLHEGDEVSVFIQKNEHFRLPQNPNASIVMVGPGTGIAPFRSFIEERGMEGTRGKTWLFFGDQHQSTDFLYEDEFKTYQKKGVLTRMETAFSRDGEQKVYVQNKMMENSKELFEWIKNGAYLYVCGDKEHMAKDVHDTLIQIIQKEKGVSREEAENDVNDLQKQGRYQRDVY